MYSRRTAVGELCHCNVLSSCPTVMQVRVHGCGAEGGSQTRVVKIHSGIVYGAIV